MQKNIDINKMEEYKDFDWKQEKKTLKIKLSLLSFDELEWFKTSRRQG